MATMTEPRQQPKIQQNQCFIGGQWLPAASGKTFETINPATEEVITNVAEGDAADVDLAVAAARKALDNGPWSRMDARDRGRLMYKLADMIEEEIDELAALESLDNGKPIREAATATCRSCSTCYVITPAMPTRFMARRSPSAANSSATRGASRSASSGRSFPGISRCSWRPGNGARHWPPAARS